MMKGTILLLTGLLGISQAGMAQQFQLVDKQATPATQYLYNNLHRLLDKGVMLGHQDDLAYGCGWKYVPGKSDVKEIAGDYPAVYGWELGGLELDWPVNLDSVPFTKMKQFIRDGYKRGGVITISWHAHNPFNGKTAWDVEKGTVASILPGGSKHALYLSWLNKVAAFLGDVKDIPILFRPFHELTGDWFWWGRSACTPEEFKSLFRFTISYLKDVKGLHNLIYVYNTSQFSNTAEFLERFPGYDVADVLSVDIYQQNDPSKDDSFTKAVDNNLGIIDSLCREHQKLPALAETGYEQIPYAAWWTKSLLPALDSHRVSYVLLWRNAGYIPSSNKLHYYIPTKNDVSAADFIRFKNSGKILLEKDVAREKVYQRSTKR